MRETLGARLRQHRERRGLTLSEIAAQTKIKKSLLDGLERDDLSQWPAGIFRRAYVKTYASAIGFDPDAAVREIQELYPEPIEPIEPPAPPSSRLRSLVQSAFRPLSRSAPASSIPPASPAASKPALGVATTGHVASAAEPAPPAPPPPEPPVARVAPVAAPPSTDLLAAARVCTELGRVGNGGQLPPLLRDAARILSARGLIVWAWDAAADELKPVLVHGYSAKVRARLSGVSADADNLTADAFRSSELRAGGGSGRGALAVPLLNSGGCGGVLAIELPEGAEQAPAVRAIAIFLAAMLAQLVGIGTPRGEEGPTVSPDAPEPVATA